MVAWRWALAVPVVAIALQEWIASQPRFVDDATAARLNVSGATMKALVSESPGRLVLKDVPIPEPGYGEILVEMSYAPINPSDIYQAFGTHSYTEKNEFPHLNGIEGVGRVVKSGGGIPAFAMVKSNLRVSVATIHRGTWAQYVVADALQSLPLSSSLSDIQGAAAFVNPLTVLAMLEVANDGVPAHKAMVHTAASSALGLMLVRAAKPANVTIICVVRGEHNVRILRDEVNHPADLIVRSDQDDFEQKLAAVIKRTGATLAFDAVGGEMSRKVYSALPERAEMYVYGRLSGKGITEDLVKSATASKPVSYFLVHEWLDSHPPLVKQWRLARILYKTWNMLPNELATNFERVLPLDGQDTLAELEAYYKHQKGGKMVLKLAP